MADTSMTKGDLISNRRTPKSVPRVGMLPIVLVVLTAFFTILQPRFMSIGNLVIVARQVSFLVIVACAEMIPILTGGIDLSVGSTAGLISVVTAIATLRFGLVAGCIAGVLGGALIGLINGSIIGKFRVAPFIVTLGTLSMARGLALTITGGQTVYGLPPSFRVLGSGYVLGIPVPIIVALAVVIITWILLDRTRFGRYLYAIGGNAEAARLSGINVTGYIILAYVYCGCLAGLNAVLLASRVNSGQPNLGSGLELDAVAAVVIGGVPLSGGQGKLRGILMGSLILGMLSNGCDLLNVSSFIQMIVIGAIIVLAVLADKYRRS